MTFANFDPQIRSHSPGFALQHLDPAHPYLAERGLSAETIAGSGIGCCQKGSMTGRIVVPIHNAEGQLVACAGPAGIMKIVGPAIVQPWCEPETMLAKPRTAK